MSKVLVVFGTRPEAVKLAPVIAELRRRNAEFETIVCATGQHRELVEPLVWLFDLRPQFELDAMLPGQSLAPLTARLLIQIDEVIQQVRPDWLLAQGDTTTAMTAALAAFYRDVRFGHVEAGLRTGNRHSPFPEEINRRIADLVADRYFAPTPAARAALLAEGAPASAIDVTGNTVVDAVKMVLKLPFDWSASPLAGLTSDAPLVLVTAHRRENLGPPLVHICQAIGELARRFAETQFVFPLHLNPEVQQTARRSLPSLPNLRLLEPFDYPTTIHLLRRSQLVLTDSGGIQEEAPSLRVPVLVMRDTTERPEGLAAGVAKLVGTSADAIVAAASELLASPEARAQMISPTNPYGDGRAAERIVAALA
jgi:UDP-N-acetylglucosamine 2-epimerase (non-hydrolysing)